MSRGREFELEVVQVNTKDPDNPFSDLRFHGKLEFGSVNLIEYLAYSVLKAKADKLAEALEDVKKELKFIKSRDQLMFAECQDAEDIMCSAQIGLDISNKSLKEYRGEK